MAPPDTYALASHTVLVVDDEPIIRESVAEALTDAGVITFEAEDAHTAIRLLEVHPDIDFVISDINMPGGLSGIDLCLAIHARFPQVKIALTSGRPPVDQSGIPAGTLFLQKPYILQDLVDRVRSELLDGDS